MKKLPILFLMALSSYTFQGCNSAPKTKDSSEIAEESNEKKEDIKATPVDEDDADFAVKAASGGLLEVTMGKLAGEKGQTNEIKDLGAMLVKDHSQANDNLQKVTINKNVTLPTALDEKQQKMVDELGKLSGKDFDKKFLSMMDDDHKQDLKVFEKASKDAKDPDLKAFAVETTPVIQHHYEVVKALEEQIN